MTSTARVHDCDYDVSIVEAGEHTYNYRPTDAPVGTELPGLSVFARNEQGEIFHTYSSYSRGLEQFMTIYRLLDVVPKGRDLVAVSSMTRVDEGQQKEMKDHMDDEDSDWSEWIHQSRLHLIRTGVDWVSHMGHAGEKKPGTLQAFNVSLPIWFDGLTKHEFMNSLRRLWLAKLALIHEIKYSYGPGVGKPGPVDDWAKSKPTNDGQSVPEDIRPAAEIEFDEKMSFGSGFDPSEWA